MAGEKRTVQCQSCKAVSVFDPEQVGQNCQFADLRRSSTTRRSRRRFGHRVSSRSRSASQVREQIRRWYASKWLAPGKLKSRALVDRVHGVYIPYWTFDAQVVCPWDADAGHYYYTTESYMEGGRTRTRQVRHVRWVPASGEVQHFFDDEPVPGTRGVSHALLAQVEPFATAEHSYDTAFLSGFICRSTTRWCSSRPRRHRRDAMTEKLRQICAPLRFREPPTGIS